ncbi:conserved hypothetical protein [Ricinus communis]|uniref:Uncharacterized protein n=1 Tax=Ricinus communis TaxID=3988 RepID=B9T831_RICCO|nr:conserved hypothetical protein [Ricinus communis]
MNTVNPISKSDKDSEHGQGPKQKDDKDSNKKERSNYRFWTKTRDRVLEEIFVLEDKD